MENRLMKCLGFVLGIALALPAGAQSWKPERNVEIVVNAGAGGAADRQARFIQKLLQPTPGMPSISVVNRTGGGGIVALTYMTQHPGDAHYLSTLTTAILTNNLVGTLGISLFLPGPRPIKPKAEK